MLLRATDATGRQVSCVYKRGSGPRHATVYGDESLRSVRFLIEDDAPERHRFLEDLGRVRRPLKDLTGPDLARPELSGPLSGGSVHVIGGPNGRRLGTLGDPAGVWEVIWRGAYEVADASGEPVGRIFRDTPFRPSRRVELHDTTVLRLRRHGPPRGGYELEKTADFPAEKGELLLASIIAVILNDWWRDR